MENEKISVIVPLYKVEPYINKCLDSIINQSYKNLEIILVDDGSPDRCGEICDFYAGRDNRIRVIHKANGGVSSARNEGLKRATGDWIGWVDSDDWIEADMFQYMLEHAAARQADIAVCSRYEHNGGRKTFRGWQQEEILDTKTALGLLLQDDKIQNYVWDKLFRKELFQNIIFPEGRTFEDVAVMYKIFEAANCVVCLPDPKYNYLQRPESIVHSSYLKDKVNYYTGAKERYEEMKSNWPEFEPVLTASCVNCAMHMWSVFCITPKEERRKYLTQMKSIAEFSTAHYKETLSCIKLGLAGRMVVRLTPYANGWAFAAAGIVGWMYKLIHGQRL